MQANKQNQICQVFGGESKQTMVSKQIKLISHLR